MLFRYAVTLLTSVLAIGFLVHAWRQRSYGLTCLAAWMASLAACAWVIVLSIGPDRRMTAVGLLLVPLLSTPAGPLLLGYVQHALQGGRLHPAWFAPFAAHLAAALLLGTGLNRWISLTSVIWLEYACLLLSWWVWARSDAADRGRVAIASVLAAVTALQLANAAQTLAVLGVIEMTPAVRLGPFYVVSAWSLGAIVFALLESPSLRRLAPGLVPSPESTDRDLFVRLQALMGEGQP